MISNFRHTAQKVILKGVAKYFVRKWVKNRTKLPIGWLGIILRLNQMLYQTPPPLQYTKSYSRIKIILDSYW